MYDQCQICISNESLPIMCNSCKQRLCLACVFRLPKKGLCPFCRHKLTKQLGVKHVSEERNEKIKNQKKKIKNQKKQIENLSSDLALERSKSADLDQLKQDLDEKAISLEMDEESLHEWMDDISTSMSQAATQAQYLEETTDIDFQNEISFVTDCDEARERYERDREDILDKLEHVKRSLSTMESLEEVEDLLDDFEVEIIDEPDRDDEQRSWLPYSNTQVKEWEEQEKLKDDNRLDRILDQIKNRPPRIKVPIPGSYKKRKIN